MKKIYLVLVTILCLLSGAAMAQFKTLLTFNGANGSEPIYSSLAISGNTLYGTTTYGGAYDSGAMYSIDTNGGIGTYTDLHDFHGKNGTFATGSLVSFGNLIYGVTALGGKNDSGCIFSIHNDGSGYKDIFDFDGSNGKEPLNGLTLSGSTLYGTTNYGGVLGLGCIFSVDTNGSNYQDIHDFIGPNGKNPYCRLAIYGNKLYGVTPFGGKNDSGCVFSIRTDGSAYTDLLDFNGTNGNEPVCGVTLSGGTLYGTTALGGLLYSGCIFSIDTNGNSYLDLHDFVKATGSNPYCQLAVAGYDELVGLTTTGGAKDSGTIFSIKTDGGSYQDIYDFNHNGFEPQINSLTVSGENIYGVVAFGGANKDGVVFSFKDAVLSVDNITAQKGNISLYPSPNNGMFTIKSAGTTGGQSTVKVFNVLGEQVYSQLTNFSAPLQVNLSNQSNGVYLYKVIAENGSLTGEGKLVIQK